MQPQTIYFLALACVVIPLLPFSRSALVVGAAWLPGQLVYLTGLSPDAVNIGAACLAMVFGWLLAINDRDRAVAVLYAATVAIKVSAWGGATDSYSAWWLDFYFAMARIAILPATVKLEELRNLHRAFKTRREADRIIWKRVLCWQ